MEVAGGGVDDSLQPYMQLVMVSVDVVIVVTIHVDDELEVVDVTGQVVTVVYVVIVAVVGTRLLYVVGVDEI